MDQSSDRQKDVDKLAAANQPVMKVIHDYFGEHPEIFETAMYAMSTLAISDAILQGMMTKATETKGIPPEAFFLVTRFDNGLTQNDFYLQNFAAIKMQLAMSDIKLNTMRQFVVQGEKTGEPVFFEQAKAILFSRFDVLTCIAFNAFGINEAEAFDLKLRCAIELSPEFSNYFKSKGV